MRKHDNPIDSDYKDVIDACSAGLIMIVMIGNNNRDRCILSHACFHAR